MPQAARWQRHANRLDRCHIQFLRLLQFGLLRFRSGGIVLNLVSRALRCGHWP